MLGLGLPANSLLKECSSYDTVGNGYFSLTIHAIPARWRRLAVITSAFHMPRARAIFDTTYGLATRSLLGGPFALSYHEASDEGLFDPEVLATRVAKEQAAVATWQRDTSAFARLADLHAWLHATHLCYAVYRQHEVAAKDDPKLAATY
ncbi:hypothetical protein F751_1441 [Auxenochlorella protothecoides]|nr:hypothetical protein F751_1441 [Auxenochlorella protothecoides]KFM25827.1 hypothetical protein F751_1441 [Auxenochlorella protothecoides]RMZ55820.1 hypothetical protein APUTEX25_003786 [Auxenochlorella protothecoides]|eukprot:RMZ55820.1 hypothetical protein APUTEX25_003786 [Auxenochlorella protothecoides]